MILGLLPEVRGGLGALAESGQASRFVDGYLRPYAAAFDEVRYFSYRAESLRDYVDDAALARRVHVVPGGGAPWPYSARLAFRHRRAIAGCAVLRVFQLTGVLPALVARRLYGTPFVTTYGFRYDRLARTPARARLHRLLERLGLRAADAVIVTTDEMRAHVTGRVRRPEVVHLIPNGVDTALFHPVERAAGLTRTILYVGRLSPEKNLGAIVAAAGTLRSRLDVEVAFVGDGPQRASLQAQARRLGVPLRLTPVVEHRRLPALYAEADVFVLPSFTEGHAKVLLEAMSCGLPCVASDVGGNRAVLVHGATGLLFDPRETAALAAALERALTDKELAQALGVRARQEAVQRYDLGALVAREIELLRRVARR